MLNTKVETEFPPAMAMAPAPATSAVIDPAPDSQH
jgi:hypothetical protein